MEEPVFYLKDTHKARALQMFDFSLVVICSHFGLNQSTDEQLEVDPLVVELETFVISNSEQSSNVNMNMNYTHSEPNVRS